MRKFSLEAFRLYKYNSILYQGKLYYLVKLQKLEGKSCSKTRTKYILYPLYYFE